MLSLKRLINTKQTLLGMSKAEELFMYFDITGRICYFATLINENVGFDVGLNCENVVNDI